MLNCTITRGEAIVKDNDLVKANAIISAFISAGGIIGNVLIIAAFFFEKILAKCQQYIPGTTCLHRFHEGSFYINTQSLHPAIRDVYNCNCLLSNIWIHLDCLVHSFSLALGSHRCRSLFQNGSLYVI